MYQADEPSKGGEGLDWKCPLTAGEPKGFLVRIRKPKLDGNMRVTGLKWGQWERPKSCDDWIRNNFLASVKSRMLTESTTPREVLMKTTTVKAAKFAQSDVESTLSLAIRETMP